jgi:hypothetical protein
MQFLSAEGIALMGIDNFGDEKAYAIERFPDRTKSAVTGLGEGADRGGMERPGHRADAERPPRRS